MRRSISAGNESFNSDIIARMPPAVIVVAATTAATLTAPPEMRPTPDGDRFGNTVKESFSGPDR